MMAIETNGRTARIRIKAARILLHIYLYYAFGASNADRKSPSGMRPGCGERLRTWCPRSWEKRRNRHCA
jgi:hypothetical protein